ncbi:4Fe-4S dicluster domain-containing protein [Desulfohalovibrio reitneri]|uniref:4Fe-4S dicluster domain-containing protein n=1 Tax=Desulfohalovibrio reitneri TaxID=1307759 RepID=UPI0004A78242|nr:4Fe-4S dicluster domain-containing protein [Desulfohalovibrio reitneri]
MSRIEIQEDRCKGCLLCTVACPVDLLRQADRFNAMGYKVVEADPERLEECTGCAACAKLCPDCCITVYRTAKKAKEG